MKKFTVKFQRQFDIIVEADDIKIAERRARQALMQFLPATCTLLSIIAEDYVEPPEAPKPSAPRGHPHGGGSPGPTIVRVPVLVDQIAKVA